MIMCDQNTCCEGWYHYTCEGLSETLVSSITQYACRGCDAAGTARTTYKGKREDGGEDAVEGGAADMPGKQHSSITGSKRKASVLSSVSHQEHQKAKKPRSDEHATSDQQDEVAQNNRRSSAPRESDINAYKRIADKLNVDLHYLQGYDASDAQQITPNATANVQARMADILDRNQAIHAQIGLMEIMRLDDADFAAIQAHPKAAEEFLEAHLERVIEVQQTQIKELEKEMMRLKQEPGSKPFLFNLWKLFGFEQPGAIQLEGEVDRTG